METLNSESRKSGAPEGEAKFALKHIREVRVNYRGPKLPMKTILAASDAADFVRPILPDNSREHFVVLYLNGAHQVSSYAVISTGNASSCPVHPREVYQRAVLVGAAAIIAVHNHPSGVISPSAEDSKVTEAVKKAGETLGIKLLDHIIVGSSTHYSFCETGKL